jgi:hypothetical protein
MFIVKVIFERHWYFAQDKNSRARPLPSDSFSNSPEKALTKTITQYRQRNWSCAPQGEELTVTARLVNAIASFGQQEGFGMEHRDVWLYCQNPAPGRSLREVCCSMMMRRDGSGKKGG